MNDIPKAIARASQNDQAATCLVLAESWLREHPDDLRVTDVYAEMLYKLTRYEEAISVYAAAIHRFPAHRWAIYNELGNLCRYRGSFPEAERWYRKASEENPNEATSFIFLGSIQARQGNLKGAEESHRRATACTDGCIDEAFHNLGLVLRGQGRLADAAVCFRKALEMDPEYEEAAKALEDVTGALNLLGDEDG